MDRCPGPMSTRRTPAVFDGTDRVDHLITASSDALTFMNAHWSDLTNGYNSWNDYGWRGSPPSVWPSYIATIAATKGFTELGIETFNGHNWYDDFANVIIANQWRMGTGAVVAMASSRTFAARAGPC